MTYIMVSTSYKNQGAQGVFSYFIVSHKLGLSFLSRLAENYTVILVCCDVQLTL